MPKQAAKTTFVCGACGAESPRWLGRCSDCGQWNSFEEKLAETSSGRHVRLIADGAVPQEVSAIDSSAAPRAPLGLQEVDRVLGGGIVPGSITLIGGDPGIGKSTLLLQIAHRMASSRGRVLYVSGEESPQQIKLRAERLGVSGDGLLLLAETELERVLGHLDRVEPVLAVVDSIQTMYLEDVASGAGSVAQVRECTLRLMQWAKVRSIPLFVAGHVTKDGAIAGPRLLEHMVDVVLYMEGEGFSPFRVLRSVKNRFGSTNEVGIFEMAEGGLVEVKSPSEAFLAHRREAAPGSAVVPTLEGTRPLLVEIEALVTPTAMPSPRRVANGVDFNRLLLIVAVLTKHLGFPLSNQDILVNVVGGLRVAEPAADAAIALAIASSLRNAPLRTGTVAIGEIGLNGELRPVSQLERRLAEAGSLGFDSCLLPRAGSEKARVAKLRTIAAATVREAVGLALVTPKRPEGELFEDED